jgi:hypothetical protein
MRLASSVGNITPKSRAKSWIRSSTACAGVRNLLSRLVEKRKILDLGAFHKELNELLQDVIPGSMYVPSRATTRNFLTTGDEQNLWTRLY